MPHRGPDGPGTETRGMACLPYLLERLAGGELHRPPEGFLRVDLLPAEFDNIHGEMDEEGIPFPDDHPCFPGHGGVYGVLGEKTAEDGIPGVCRDGPDDVAGIDIPDIHLHVDGLKVPFDGLLQKHSDIMELPVSRIVVGRGFVGEVFLPRPFRHHNKGVVSFPEPFLQGFKKSRRSVELEIDLRDEDVIHVLLGQGSLGGDESRFPPHEFDDPDAVGRPTGLDMSAPDRFDGLRKTGLETEGLGNEGDIVVDGLGDVKDCDMQLPLFDFLDDVECPPDGSVAPDGEEDLNSVILKAVNDHFRIRIPPGGAQNGSPEVMDVFDVLRREADRVHLLIHMKPPVSVPDADDVRHPVLMMELHDQGMDHVVQAGAQAAAGDDGRHRVFRREENPLPGTRPLQGDEILRRHGFFDPGVVHVIKNPLVIPDEIDVLQRGTEDGVSNRFDFERNIHLMTPETGNKLSCPLRRVTRHGKRVIFKKIIGKNINIL